MNRTTTNKSSGMPPVEPPPQQTQKPYALDYNAVRRGRVGTAPVSTAIAAGVVAAVLVVIFCVMMLLMVPPFEKILMDFKVELPWITRLCLGISRGMRVFPSILVVLAALGTVPVIVGAAVTSMNSRRDRPLVTGAVIRWVAFFILFCMAVFFALAIFLPMVELIGAVSGAKK